MEQLKRKDQEYIKAMGSMNDDIDQLIDKMQQQYKALRSAYQENLISIEKAFEDERTQILDQNKAEIKQLFEEQKKIEKEHAEHRAKTEESYAKQLEEVRNLDANNQAEQKIKLEKEMQILEKCMEDMKAVYKLNEEKLTFNHRVLQEKIKVNEATIKTQREKERKFKEVKRKVKKQFFAEQKKA